MQDLKTFIPSLHGFSFANRFPGYPLPSFIYTFPSVSRFLSSSQEHGLCGGMCFAAYDFFIAKRTITSDTTVPKSGSPLYNYLYKRQLDTYGFGWKLVAKFAQWTVLPDATVARLTADELHKVIVQIHNSPVILGLVYVSIVDTMAIWLNHQVLAYGYSEEDPKTINIKIYDPNLPYCDDVVIELKRETSSLQCTQKASRNEMKVRVRGFFVIPYAPVEPPMILSEL
jgi:hypothetical protein